MEEQAQPQEGQDGGGDIGSLLQNLAQGMSVLDETFQSAGIRPDLAEKVSAIKGELMAVIDEIGKGGGAPQAAAGPVPMEQGAGGVPQSQAMR